jgi:hypothetical protein
LAAELYNKGLQIFLIKKMDSEIGEASEFHNKEVLCYLLNASSLHGIVTIEGIEMYIILDGAVLCKI